MRGIEQLGDDAIVVRYEEFVAAPEKNLKQICEALAVDYTDGLLEYDNSTDVQGFMQDRTGIHKYSRPEKQRSESWRDLLADPQQIHFAQAYLAALGREQVEAFGYPYDELLAAVNEAAKTRGNGGSIFPWRVAIKHPNQLQGRDQQAISLYRNIRDYGPVRGRLKTMGNFFEGLWRSVRFVFSGG
jgi:hypothetical protein